MLFCTLILASCSSNSTEIIENTTQAISKITVKPIESDILYLINNYRADKGLSSLQELQIIKSQTTSHTNYMIEKNEVSHEYFFKRKNFLVKNANATSVAENVAYGYTSAQTVVKAWIKSEGHKKNIEGDFTHFNVTAAQNKDGKWFYTNIFIKKK